MAKQAELLNLQKTARVFYEAKKYAEALDNFSKAVVLAQKWSPSDVPNILDQRVAVYVKLGNIDLARKDAVSMIRANKADGRGYLRCGQLDRLEDNPSAALRWYEHGLKHVPTTDPLRSTLDAQRDKTKRLLDQELMASNMRDPVSTLPAELIRHVATYLNYAEIVKVLRVSKAWKETFSRLKPLTDSVDFSDTKCEINYKMMVAVLKRLGSNPKRLIMKTLSDPAESLLWMNLARWQNYTQLEELTIAPSLLRSEDLPFAKYNLKILNLGIEHGTLDGPMVVRILKGCRSLEVARFSNLSGYLGCGHGGVIDGGVRDDLLCPTVRTLDLVGGRCVAQTGTNTYSGLIDPRFFASFPCLEELACRDLRMSSSEEVFDISGIPSLRKLLLSSCVIDRWPKLPPNIEVWDNYDTKTCEAMFFVEGIETSRIGTLGKLKFLRFNKTSRPPQLLSFLPTKSRSSLTGLDVRTTYADSLFGTASPRDFLKQLINLRELAWGDNEDGQTLGPLDWFENLEIVSLLASPIHGAELIHLLKRPHNRLRQITLTDCENVSSDTIEWARNRGVTMHVKKSQAVSSSDQRFRFRGS